MPFHVMLDLETFGTTPDSAILSIGAVVFGTEVEYVNQLEFYEVVSRRSCEQLGLRFDPDTLAWWERQTDKAREVLRQCELIFSSNSLPNLLLRLRDHLDRIALIGGGEPLIWGNGSDFDNALLQFAAFKCGLPPLWGHRQNRCYRTLRGLLPQISLPELAPGEVEHHALHDARRQAHHARSLLRSLESRRP